MTASVWWQSESNYFYSTSWLASQTDTQKEILLNFEYPGLPLESFVIKSQEYGKSLRIDIFLGCLICFIDYWKNKCLKWTKTKPENHIFEELGKMRQLLFWGKTKENKGGKLCFVIVLEFWWGLPISITPDSSKHIFWTSLVKLSLLLGTVWSDKFSTEMVSPALTVLLIPPIVLVMLSKRWFEVKPKARGNP